MKKSILKTVLQIPQKLRLLALLFTLPIALCGQGWEIALGSDFDEYANKVQQMADGSFVVAGYNGEAFANAWMLRIDSEGEVIFSNDYGTALEAELFLDFVVHPDGRFTFVGNKNTFGAEGTNVFLAQTDEWGNENWQKDFGDIAEEEGKSIVITAEGELAILGKSTANGNQDFYLIQTDDQGENPEIHTYGGSGEEWGLKILNSPEDSLLLFGRYMNNTGDGALLIKTDLNGDSLWSQTYPGFYFSDAVATTDGYMMTGHSFDSGDPDPNLTIFEQVATMCFMQIQMLKAIIPFALIPEVMK